MLKNNRHVHTQENVHTQVNTPTQKTNTAATPEETIAELQQQIDEMKAKAREESSKLQAAREESRNFQARKKKERGKEERERDEDSDEGSSYDESDGDEELLGRKRPSAATHNPKVKRRPVCSFIFFSFFLKRDFCSKKNIFHRLGNR